MLAASIYRAVTQTLDWNFAAAQSVILLVGILLVMAPYIVSQGRRHG